jgi:hypothetical protein
MFRSGPSADGYSKYAWRKTETAPAQSSAVRSARPRTKSAFASLAASARATAGTSIDASATAIAGARHDRERRAVIGEHRWGA